jgi:hypothetical protein
MINLTKHQFKICEAVHLKMDYYYMGTKDKRPLTELDIMEAKLLIPMQPKGWMKNADKLPWSCLNKKKGE